MSNDRYKRFWNILDFARSVHDKDPQALFDLDRLVGRELLVRQCLRLLQQVKHLHPTLHTPFARIRVVAGPNLLSEGSCGGLLPILTRI